MAFSRARTDVAGGCQAGYARRLEAQGVLESTWNIDGAAPRRYYWLSAEGRHLLKVMTESWHCQVAVMDAYGNIFQHAHTDRVLVPAVATLAGILMAVAWIELYRELTRVRPAPASA